ncbi:hypothetical protein ABD91_20540 [Lysinibacillus sphaericus]|uniref:hypothetical protein n=1 Tax=Lysinibacillus sphaericus TaxID=1421 RepID=UPI0018CF55F6|nr:hypothetical protein [Lysinibacillus sphaericus]MBG9693132.1 hypothetical protein [Lysinibacillus sphaericus]
MKFDLITERMKEISETLISEVKKSSGYKEGSLKKHKFPKELRDRIEIDDSECKLKLKSNDTHYFITFKKKVIYGNEISKFDEGNAVELSLAIDFAEKEELLLSCIYAGVGRQDLLENLLKEPYVMMLACSQI